MSDDLETSGSPVPVDERYYVKYYYSNNSGRIGDECVDCEDQCIMQHSNRVCVVCLAPTHCLAKDPKYKIKSVEFESTIMESWMQVSGKRKTQGAQLLLPNSILCTVNCEDGTKFFLRSCIKGYLVEINEMLIQSSELLITRPLSEGFIALVIPKLDQAQNTCANLLTQQQYERVSKINITT